MGRACWQWWGQVTLTFSFLCKNRLRLHPTAHLPRVAFWKAPRLNLHLAAQHHSFVLAHLRLPHRQTFSLEAERQDSTEIYSASQVRMQEEHRCLEGFVLHSLSLLPSLCVCLCVFHHNYLPNPPSFIMCVTACMSVAVLCSKYQFYRRVYVQVCELLCYLLWLFLSLGASPQCYKWWVNWCQSPVHWHHVFGTQSFDAKWQLIWSPMSSQMLTWNLHSV